MKKLFVLPLTAISFFLITPVWAEPGDVGSIECREVQIEAQGAIDDIFRNQGQKVSTAAKVVSSYEEAGSITEECSSCIISQIARRIPVNEQKACGQEPITVECPCWDKNDLNILTQDGRNVEIVSTTPFFDVLVELYNNECTEYDEGNKYFEFQVGSISDGFFVCGKVGVSFPPEGYMIVGICPDSFPYFVALNLTLEQYEYCRETLCKAAGGSNCASQY